MLGDSASKRQALRAPLHPPPVHAKSARDLVNRQESIVGFVRRGLIRRRRQESSRERSLKRAKCRLFRSQLGDQGGNLMHGDFGCTSRIRDQRRDGHLKRTDSTHWRTARARDEWMRRLLVVQRIGGLQSGLEAAPAAV